MVGAIISIILFVIALVVIFYPRKCDLCNKRMNLVITKESEIVYKCKQCGIVKKTGFYGGGASE